MFLRQKIFSGYYDEEPACKDVTLGDCTINPDFIIQEVSGIPLEACQEACEIYANCEIFRFDGTNCMLLSYDYRQECRNSAAPVVSSSRMLLLSNKFYPSYFCQGKEWQLFQFM